ncbi:MAG: hypothetical protein ACRDM0_13675 [Thermoleophilaceae bacterium]
MSRFAEPDRERGMDMLQAAEEVFVTIGAPSRLGTVLVATCLGGMGVEEGDPLYGVAAGAALMGYACRMAHPARQLPDRMASGIEAELLFDEEDAIDYEALAEESDRLGKLLEFTASLADEPDAIASLAGCTPNAWQAFATTATYQLHRNLARNGLPKRLLPPSESVENLLRLGYAVRLIDEIAGEQPAPKSDGAAPSGPTS